MKTKVKDLIEALKNLDPEKEVQISGVYYDSEIEGVYDCEEFVEIDVREKT